MNVKLNELIQKAQGERSQNLFASQCNISSASITRVLKGDYVPSAKMLKKIASKAENGVTFEMLMNAAGLYIDTSPVKGDSSEEVKFRIPDEYKELPIAFYEGAKDLTQEDIDDVVKFMEFLKKKKSDK